jgi:hypothetical protein
MDQGGNDDNDSSMQHGESNYSLYDTFGSDMVDDVNVVDSTVFPLDPWHASQYPNVTIHQTPYDPHNANMQDIQTTQFTHGFQQGQAFQHNGQPFHGFMGHNTSGDHHGEDQGFGMNTMDLYQHTAPSIYPDLTQDTANYGIILCNFDFNLFS